MASIASSERLRCELQDLVAGVADEDDPIEAIGRLGARLILQQALEDELTEFLGRERYERRAEPVSHRNGYEPVTVKTTAGPLKLERPRVRNPSALGFSSQIVGKGVARTHALEALVICSFLRGLSVCDVEAALEETFDERVIGTSTAARVCRDTRERYRSWCERRLDEHDLVYLFLDAIYLELRPDDSPAEGVLVTWGVTLEGRKVLLGLQLGSRESYDDWLDFGRDLLARGLRSPALIVADGAPGLWKVARELWPQALEQRCGVHVLANVLRKLPERLHHELKGRYWGILDEAGSAAEARAGLLALVADYRSSYPSAMAVIERELEALVCHLRFPSEHRTRIRSTNLLERTFVEVRRRTKVIWAVLELASRGWRGVVMTPKAVVEIERLRRGLSASAAVPDEHAEEVVAG
ncbi:MAG: IS256 family transposase [Mycolicibacterium hassiacum]|uniref:IS256 family transposase n=1 Tax=Mycolicibacterium hassiacum TaxID=46351 RepID=UPI0023F61846|nr:IS256 family transposase [Mycolicibacterium hassiacum]MBX5485426.1 IS256 family transposase [Mycolicibacterium hassiacum]